MPSHRHTGFSLIELLVALLVIVLLTSVVSLNVGGGQALKRTEEVRHLAATMGYAQTQAELAGSDFGLLIEREVNAGDDRYVGRWLQRFDQGWAQPSAVSDVLEPFIFESGAHLMLALIDDPDVLIQASNPELNPVPQVVFFAGGEVAEGELDWIDAVSGELLFRLQWDLFGRTEILPRGQRKEGDETR